MATDPRMLMQQAVTAFQSGDLDKAQVTCQHILATHPSFLQAKLMLSMSHAMKGEHDQAVEGFRDLIRIDSTCQPAYNWLASILRERGEGAEALKMAENSVRLLPQSADAVLMLGMCLFDAKRYVEAAETFRRATKLAPAMAAARSALASSLEELGQWNLALSAARKAAALAPSPEEFIRLARLESSIGNAEEAVKAFRRVIEFEPEKATNRIVFAQYLRDAGSNQEAEREIAEAERLDPELDAVYTEKAVWLQSHGRFAEARSMFEKALEINPGLGIAYYGIVSAAKATEQDTGLLRKMEDLVESRTLPPEEEIHLQYAIGKMYDDLGKYEAAMRSYDTANGLAKHLWLTQPFDRQRFESDTSRKIEMFTPKLFEQLRSHGSKSDRPLFVVGMMRSGTTLTEQMLTRHSQIGGVGEQAFWAQAESDFLSSGTSSLNGSLLEKLSPSFLQLLERMAPGKRYVIDKNPANVMAVGFIHAAYPNAKIIHVVRNPVDTALSMYMTPVRKPPHFTCDRANIVFAYQQYQRLAEHWRKVIPADNLHEVSYEQITSDGPTAVRGILDFLGLEFEETCLHPEDNVKTVRTPSFWQVRQPLYTSSVARWKRYEAYLGEFAELLV